MSTEASRQYNWVDDKNNTVAITASRMDTEFDNVITKLNQKVIIKSSAPSGPIAGMLWVDSTNRLLKEYRNSEWVIHGVVHIGTSAPSTVQAGDIWVDTTNLLLKVYPSSGTGWLSVLTSPSGTAIGDITYFSSTTVLGRLPVSTSGMFLQNKGSLSAPVWASPDVNKPAFQVRKSVSQDNIAVGVAVTITWDTEIFDDDSCFASNTFTASVTGRYSFCCYLEINSAVAGVYYSMNLVTSNRSYLHVVEGTRGPNGMAWIAVDMEAGDTAYITIQQASGTQQADIGTNSYFSGCLIKQL